MDFFDKFLGSFLGQLFFRASSLVSSIILARYLGPRDFGIFAAIFVLPEIITAFANFGQPAANTYFLSHKHNTFNHDELILNCLFFALVSGLIFGALWYLSSHFLDSYYFNGSTPLKYIKLVSLSIPLFVLRNNFKAILRGKYKIREYNILFSYLNNGGRLLLIVMLVLLLKLQTLGAILANILIVLFIDVYIIVKLIKGVHGSIKLNFELYKTTFSYGMKAYLGTWTNKLAGSFDIILITNLLSIETVGLYVIAQRVSSVIIMVGDALLLPFQPKLTSIRGFESQRNFTTGTVRMLLITNLVILGIIYLIGPTIINICYGAKYNNSILLLYFILPNYVFVSLILLANAFFMGIGRPLIRTYLRMIQIVFSFIIIYFGVCYYGAVGAALSKSLISCSIFFISLFFMKHFLEDCPIKSFLIPKKEDIKYVKEIWDMMGSKINIKYYKGKI